MRTEIERENQPLSPWLAILLTAPIPILLAVLFFYKWYQQKTDLSRVTSHFVERQNTVLAYDAVRVSRHIQELLESSEREVRHLDLVAVQERAYIDFAKASKRRLVRLDPNSNETQSVSLPLFREVSALDNEGKERLRVVDGKRAANRTLDQCQREPLCDFSIRKKALASSVGSTHYGRNLRYYVDKHKEEDHSGASLSVVLRTANGLRVVGIDYRHFRDVLYVPTFPYEPRKQLLQAYQDGNYTYYVNGSFDIIAHPKHWHVAGLKKGTRQWVSPAVEDKDMGTQPVNVAAYQGEQLRPYFDRLMKTSFRNRSVDIFRASNLTGKIRVHAVAPILFDKGQYKDTGVFGYVITGCYVDYFEEPKEKFVPYY